MVREMCGVQFIVRKRDLMEDLIFTFGLNETFGQMAMVSSVCWYGHVLRREDSDVLIRALDFVVESQRKKGRLKRTWKRQVEEESMKFGLRSEDALCRSKWIVGVNVIATRLR